MKKIILFLLLCSAAKADDSLVILLDTSGSMSNLMGNNTRMQVAQQALLNVLEKVPPTTKVGILTFHDWIYDLQPADYPKMEQAIRHARHGGGTPLYFFAKKAANRLLLERKNNLNVGNYKLLIVTDGEAQDGNLNSDHGDVPGVMTDILHRGITVDAIGVAMAKDHLLSTQINGSYMRGDDPESLEKSLQRAVSEIGFANSQDANVDAFQDIADLPDDFVLAVLKGLTTFQNQPIGEKFVEEIEAKVEEKAIESSFGITFLLLVVLLPIVVGFTATAFYLTRK